MLSVVAMAATLMVALAAAPRGGRSAVGRGGGDDDACGISLSAQHGARRDGDERTADTSYRGVACAARRCSSGGGAMASGEPLAMLAVRLRNGRGGGLFSRELAPDRGYPSAALAFMNAHGLHGNVLNEFGWGEYLIWHAAPADKVFIDGRYDTVYPFKVIRDYLEFYFDEPDASAVLESYPHDFVLIGLQAPARRLMERRRDWKLLYRDNDALLYARASAPAARLPDLPVTATRCRADFHDARAVRAGAGGGDGAKDANSGGTNRAASRTGVGARSDTFAGCVTHRHFSPSSS